MNKTFYLILLYMLFGAESGVTQTVNENLWVTNGQVNATVVVGDTAYIGGSFTMVGPATGQGVALDPISGFRDAGFPKVIGLVQTVVADGSGGWIIGGDFKSVGGLPRNRLARIRSDKTLDSTWKSGVNGTVSSLVVTGNTVYACGYFNTVNDSVSRKYLAAFELTTGKVKPWNPEPNDFVLALAVSGSTVYAGGRFTFVNDFSVSRNRLAAFDTSLGKALEWNPNVNSFVNDLVVSGNTVFVSGVFNSVNGNITRNYLAAFDCVDGKATAWNPNPNSFAYTLEAFGSSVYAGGNFTSVNGNVSRNFLAAFDTAGGKATAWNPIANAGVVDLEIFGGKVYACGEFTWVNEHVARNRLAAFDMNTGNATGWNPNANWLVNSIAVSGSMIYAGGAFTSINNNEPRNFLAAFNLTTDKVTSWNPNANGLVFTIVQSGGTIYAGGSFDYVNGVERKRLAAFDLVYGNAKMWNPNMNQSVTALAISGGTLYAGGNFTSVNGNVSRNRLAAFDLVNGIARDWNPNVSGGTLTEVNALVAFGSSVYVGGNFTTVNGNITRNYLAAFDLVNGTASAWNPNVSGGTQTKINALAAFGSSVYAGGNFTTVNGNVSRNYLASFDFVNGTATVWNPNVNGFVVALAVASGSVYAGGGFNFIGHYPNSYFAGISTSVLSAKEIDTPKSLSYLLHQNFPNPFNPSTTIKFSIPIRTQIDLEVFDVLGRKVAVLERGLKDQGVHTVQFNASFLASGVYFYRLKAASGFMETKKMILVK